MLRGIRDQYNSGTFFFGDDKKRTAFQVIDMVFKLYVAQVSSDVQEVRQKIIMR